MEIIGAYLRLEQDQAIYNYFSRLLRPLFPRPFENPSHHLYAPGGQLVPVQRKTLAALAPEHTPQKRLGLIDSLPLPVCRFARATFCKRFRYFDTHHLRATYGHDHVARQTFWRFRLHLHVACPGLITRLIVAPAHESDVALAPQMVQGHEGIIIGDRNYHSPDLSCCSRTNPVSNCWLPSKTKSVIPPPKPASSCHTGAITSEPSIANCANALNSNKSGLKTCGICSTAR